MDKIEELYPFHAIQPKTTAWCSYHSICLSFQQRAVAENAVKIFVALSTAPVLFRENFDSEQPRNPSSEDNIKTGPHNNHRFQTILAETVSRERWCTATHNFYRKQRLSHPQTGWNSLIQWKPANILLRTMPIQFFLVPTNKNSACDSAFYLIAMELRKYMPAGFRRRYRFLFVRLSTQYIFRSVLILLFQTRLLNFYGFADVNPCCAEIFRSTPMETPKHKDELHMINASASGGGRIPSATLAFTSAYNVIVL